MKLMLDSGAYSAFRKGLTIDIEKYLQFLKDHEDLFDCTVNLDVIGSGEKSYENWKWLRKNGSDTLPVYHIGTDVKWLEKYLKKTDYVGIGAIANLSSVKRIAGLDLIWKKYLKKKGKPTHKIHAMGLTAVDIVTRYPWYSIDSISPVLQAGFGGIYVPRMEDEKFNFLKLDMYKISDESKAHYKRPNRSEPVMASYFGLQERKKVYDKYFESKGFIVGKLIANKNQKEHGQREIGFVTDTQEEHPGKTLTNDYTERLRWNLTIWIEFNKQVPDVLIYVGSASHFKYVVESDGKLGQLFSFFELNTEAHLKTKMFKYFDPRK